jgi:hypothetical protein
MSKIQVICIGCATANGGVLNKGFVNPNLFLRECDVCGEPRPVSAILAWENLNPHDKEAYQAKVAAPKRTRAKKTDDSEIV